jgi:DNA polymerase-1
MKIPEEINSWPKVQQVRFYLDSGLLIQPVYGPNSEIDIKDRGKKPRLTLDLRMAQSRDDVLARFANGSDDNVGQIPTHINPSIDLDDKSEEGRALTAFWLLYPDLEKLPRAVTNRGAHLHFVCNDIPETVKKLTNVDLLPGLSAELICDQSQNIVLPPSVHVSGVQYKWVNVGGIIPLIPWARIQQIFRFPVAPERCQMSTEWKTGYKGDLRSLNLIGLCKHLGIYGELRDADDAKHSVQCPWRSEHTNGSAGWEATCSESVIYTPAGKTPRFKCLHGHCSSRTISDLLAWADAKEKGVVDKACARKYAPRADLQDPLGAKPPFFEQQEERETPCPYPIVDWSQIERSSRRERFTHQAFYPKDSILEEFMELGARLTEATEGLIIGAILPVAAALLQRRVWLPWIGSSLFANIYSLLIGPAGDGKSSLIRVSDSVGKASLDQNAFLNLVNVSPQGLFEQYHEPSGGNPDNICVFDEGNIVLTSWVNSLIGEAVAAELLQRYDCLAYRETYLRNKKGNEGKSTRNVDQTSTSILFGGTFNVACFQGALVRQGMERRFLPYVSTGPGRTIIWPPVLETSALNDSFGKLRDIRGIMSMAKEGEGHWEDYQRLNRKMMLEADPWNDALIARLRTCPTHVLKLSMIFEACCAVYQKRATAATIGVECLKIAMAHVDENMRAAAYLDRYADSRSIDQQAESILATVQNEFPGWGNTVYATRSELTRKFCPNTARRGALSVSDLYDKIVPHLQSKGECVRAVKTGKFEVYAFPAEPTDKDGDDRPQNPTRWANSTNSTNSTGGVTPSNLEIESGPVEIVENSGSYDARAGKHTLSPPVENVENVEFAPNQEKGASISPPEENEENAPSFQIVDDGQLVQGSLQGLGTDCPIAIDIETHGDHSSHALQSRKGRIRILSAATRTQSPTVFDLHSRGVGTTWIKGFLENRTVISHNAKFEAEWLLHHMGVQMPDVFCTFSAAKLLSNGDSTVRNDLGSVLRRHLNVDISKGLGASDWGGMCLTSDQYRYASDDVRYLLDLANTLSLELKKANLWKVFQLEMHLLPIVVAMQDRGMPVSRDVLNKIIVEATGRCKEFESRLKPHLGAWINFDSPDQLKEAFKAIGVELENTNEETLVVCQHPAAAILLEYRGAEMERRQAESLLENVVDGRIHAQFKPLGTETGRFSSANPNLQNVGRGSLRSAFKPSGAEHVLIVADYSQIELRVAAALAKDEAMLAAFASKEDLHRKTAAIVLGKREDSVSKGDRQLAKATNFGLLYGQGAEGLVRYAKTAYGVELKLPQAKRIRASFFKHYKGLAAWHEQAWKQSGSITEGRTLLGRRRLASKDASNWDKFLLSVNFRDSGTAADCLKQAMIDLAPKIAEHDAYMVATVHDELVIECPRSNASAVRDLSVTIMVNAATTILNGAVPLEVEASICESWGDK